MDLILEQMPIVLPALNAGFVQTLKLFIVTLVGALPLGLIIAFGAMTKFKPLSLFTKFIIWIIYLILHNAKIEGESLPALHINFLFLFY